MIKSTELSMVIVNYKNYALTIECIESVLKTVKNICYEIIVVDNDSPNESYEKLKGKYGDINNIRVIKNDNNAGFGAANNLGAELSTSKYILLLNPDIIVLDNAIEIMLDKLKSDDTIGLVSGKLLNKDGSTQASCRRILPFNQFLASRTPLSKITSKEKKEKINDIYIMSDYDHTTEKVVDWVMGACMLMEKEYFFKLGGFSKEYFMYFEDVDLCYKVKKSGKKVLYLPEAKMIHLHNQESTKKLNKMSLIHLQSMIKFYYKYKMNKF